MCGATLKFEVKNIKITLHNQHNYYHTHVPYLHEKALNNGILQQ